jgi:UDP-N-acetylmuramoyl-L-alanyl-D-glutamate--2,6-diaminopimelate ligase
MFAGLSGHTVDGRGHVEAALARGAAAVLMEPPPHPVAPNQILVPSCRHALAYAAEAVHPVQAGGDLPVIGITGTNGKTSVAYMMHALLTAAGYAPALAGSIETRYDSQHGEATHTTPEAPDLHRWWAQARDRGADALVLEASSHGLLLHRVDRIGFNVGVFTNLTRDHLDYHPEPIAYRGAKTRLFSLLPVRGHAVICADDPAWSHFARATRARVLTFGQAETAAVRAEQMRVAPTGITLELVAGKRRIAVETRLYGRFNVANITAAGAAAVALGLTDADIQQGFRRLEPVPGRAERIDVGQPFVVLNDFAHTPDALVSILSAARELTSGALHVVFGCGGDRDPGKRPQMGRVAAERADRLTVTSDNPRTEDPLRIIEQIVAPLGSLAGLTVEPDRTLAIRSALSLQRPGDTLVVAGKGHERYQIIGTTKHRFDDAEVLREELRHLGYGA